MSARHTMDINKVTALAVMALLLIVYAYLNANKFSYTAGIYRDIFHGAAAPELTIQDKGETLVRFNLPSTGIFDATGQHQMNFQRLDKASYERLQQRIKEADVYLDGTHVDARKAVKAQFLALQLPHRNIYLVKENDTKTIAALLWNENRRVQDVLTCRGEVLCSKIRFGWAGGIGPLQGPFLNTDLLPIRRGMPRGRWGASPATGFVIEAREPVQAKLSLLALDPSRDQVILLKGKTVTALHKIEPKTPMLNIAGKQVYPKQYMADVMLQPGRNEFRLVYSDWQGGHGKRPGNPTAYLIKLEIGE